MSIKLRFEEAVEELYRVFSVYPLPTNTGMCPCCHEPEDEAKLHSKPLRDLGYDDLWKYTFSALYTWGDVTVFKHFLPRIFELTFLATSDMPDPEVTLKKLIDAEWTSWPQNEITAVENYLTAAWEYAVCIDENIEISGILCAIGQVKDDLMPFLEAWEISGVVGISNLAIFAQSEYEYKRGVYRLSDNFWKDDKDPDDPSYYDRTQQMNQVIQWLQKPSIREIMENTYLQNSDHPLAESIAQGADYLRIMNL